MIQAYLDLAARICQELDDLEHAIARAERAIQTARQRPEAQDLYISNYRNAYGRLKQPCFTRNDCLIK